MECHFQFCRLLVQEPKLSLGPSVPPGRVGSQVLRQVCAEPALWGCTASTTWYKIHCLCLLCLFELENYLNTYRFCFCVRFAVL